MIPTSTNIDSIDLLGYPEDESSCGNGIRICILAWGGDRSGWLTREKTVLPPVRAAALVNSTDGAEREIGRAHV
jgi:hypothetical protein